MEPPALPQSKRSHWGVVALLLLLLLCFSVFLNVMGWIGLSAPAAMHVEPDLPRFEEALAQPGDKGNTDDKIAQISLRGLISSSVPGDLGPTMVDDIKLQLRQALKDRRVKAIVLLIDSPGGEVTASDVIYEAVKKAREKKPIVVCMESMAASGGYYVACAGSHTIAHETTLTGSIGVIMQSVHYQGLFEKVGLQMVTIKSGKMKDMLSGSRTLTEEELAYTQALVMQTYGKFVGIVASERKLDEAALRTGVADGRIVSGKDALEQKLVDQLGSVADAYAKAQELGKAPGARVVRYEATFSFGRLFRLFGKAEKGSGGRVEVSFTEGLLPKLEAGRFYFLPELFAPH